VLREAPGGQLDVVARDGRALLGLLESPVRLFHLHQGPRIGQQDIRGFGQVLRAHLSRDLKRAGEPRACCDRPAGGGEELAER
jgi:hypothetical protein